LTDRKSTGRYQLHGEIARGGIIAIKLRKGDELVDAGDEGKTLGVERVGRRVVVDSEFLLVSGFDLNRPRATFGCGDN